MPPGRRLIAAALAGGMVAFCSSCGGNRPSNPSPTAPVAPPRHGVDAWGLAAAYVGALNPERVIRPESIVVATHDTKAHAFGGYSMWPTAPSSWVFVNEYPSPFYGNNRYYVAAIEFTHPYARCGYDSNLNHVSDISFGGECRNVSGLTCVSLNGRWVCPNALSDLYMDQDYFTACGIVHEMMHPFGKELDGDHYGSDQCRTRTGMSLAVAADLRLAQTYCDTCPDVYQQFHRR